MSWNYAELSSLAKSLGGPEEMLYTIEQVSRASGRAQMLPWIGVAAIAGGLVCLGASAVSARRERERQKMLAVFEQKIKEDIERRDLHEAVKNDILRRMKDAPTPEECLDCPNRDAVYPSCEADCAFNEKPDSEEE